MARKNELDTAAVLRLKHEIARVRLRLAQRIEMEDDQKESPADAPTNVGRLYEVFRFMNEC